VAPKFSFDVLDTDGDGCITKAEYEKGFDMIDQNKDGFITEMEFSCVCCAPFKKLDKDGDGNPVNDLTDMAKNALGGLFGSKK
jgi:Ca2+-binding EF-hand superfamily protein